MLQKNNVTKKEAEPVIRSLVHEWAKTVGITYGQTTEPSFTAFKHWLRENGYGRYLDFRSTMGPEEDAERWFAGELGQAWRY